MNVQGKCCQKRQEVETETRLSSPGFEPSVAAIIGQHSTPAHPQMPVDFFIVNFHSKSATLLSKLISTCCFDKMEAREKQFLSGCKKVLK